MPLEKNVKIVCKRRGTAKGRNNAPKQNSERKLEIEEPPDLPAARIKIEDEHEGEAVSSNSVKGECSNSLIKPAAEYAYETVSENIREQLVEDKYGEGETISSNSIRGECSNSLIKPADTCETVFENVREQLIENEHGEGETISSYCMKGECSNSLIKPAADYACETVSEILREQLIENEHVEGETVSSNSIRGEYSNSLIKPAAEYAYATISEHVGEQLGIESYPVNELADFKRLDFLQTGVYVKTEVGGERKDFITSELVGPAVEDNTFKVEAGNHEVMKGELQMDRGQSSYLQTGLCVDVKEEQEEPVADSLVEVEDDSPKEMVKNLQGNISIQLNSESDFEQFYCPQTDFCVKTEKVQEKEGEVLSELVGCVVAGSSFKTEVGDRKEVIVENVKDLQGNTFLHLNSHSGDDQLNFLKTVERIKIEEIEHEIGFECSELVGCSISDDAFKTKTDNMVNLEQSSEENDLSLQETASVALHLSDRERFTPQTTSLCNKTEDLDKEEKPVTEKSVGRFTTSLKYNEAGDFEESIDEEKSNIQENDSIFLHSQANLANMHVKTEEIEIEEGLITHELVGHLPKDLKDSNVDTKLALLKCEDELQADGYRLPVNSFLSKGGRKASKKQFDCPQCRESFIKRSELLEHLQRHSDEKLYSCSVCPAKFKRHSQLTVHLLTHSSEKRFGCAHCNVRFKSKKALAIHLKKHTASDMSPRKYLKAFVPSHNSGTLYECAHCSVKLKTKGSLASQMTLHTSKKSHSCPQCPMTFKRNNELTSHFKQRHTGKKQYSCDQCPVKCSQASTLRRHVIRKHSSEQSFGCQHCPSKFSLKRDLEKHLRVHSDERQYACPECPAMFKCRYTLKRHLRTHSQSQSHARSQSDGRPYGCKQCDWKFKTAAALSRHVKTAHSGVDKHYACDQCSYKSHNSTDLAKHLVVHNGKKTFSCKQCSAKFTRRESLTRHMPRHSKERPFVCNVCPKTFKSKRCLQSHSKVHSKARKLNSCTECSFVTGSLRSLKAHGDAHASEVKFACQSCSAIFILKSRLEKHLLAHSDQRRFECAHCLSRFKLKHDLKSHIGRLHKEIGSHLVPVSKL